MDTSKRTTDSLLERAESTPVNPIMREDPQTDSTAQKDQTDRVASPWIALASLLICTFLALTLDGRPSGSAPPADVASFSLDRAFDHLEIIAEEPHPTGSSRSRQVVEPYLLRQLSTLGFETEIQSTTAVRQRAGRTHVVRVRNILGRRPGTLSTDSVLLLAHHDSVQLAPGAGDDGAGVAAILEALRALQESALRNDLIVLFSDGEELGLMGARAFAEQHPWADDVRVVLNFEGRGSAGASLLFETSPQNGRLIAEFSRGAAFPVGNSLSYEVYKRMPNDTDFSVFKERGFVGLNFAFIEGFSRYHSPRDEVQKLDPGSLDHHGAYVLSLSRHFGNLDLGGDLSGPDAVYFNLFGVFFHYSRAWVIPLTALATVLALAVILAGVRSGQVRWSGAWRAAAILALAALAFPVAAWALLRAVQWARLDYWETLFGMIYNGPLYLSAFLVLGVAAFSGLLALAKRPSALEGHSCAIVVWILFAWICASALPGGSFLALWPVLTASLTSGVLLLGRPRSRLHGFIRTGALILSPAVPFGLMLPVMVLTMHAFSAGIIPVLIFIWTGILALLIPVLARLDWFGGKAFPVATGLAGIALLVWAIASSSFGVDQPRWDSLFYAADSDRDEGYWLSLDQRTDEWTRNALGDSPEKAEFSRFIGFSRPLSYAAGPRWKSEPGSVQLVSENIAEGRRTIVLLFQPGEGARDVRVRVASDGGIGFVRVEDDSGVHGVSEPWEDVLPSEWTVTYHAIDPQGFSFHIDLAAGVPASFEVVERHDGLPDDPSIRLPPRPPNIIASKLAQAVDGSSFVLRRFTF